MFSRSKLKKEARISLKHNYFRAVVVCFLALILINGGYQLFSFNVKDDPTNIINNQITNVQVLEDILNGFSAYVESTNPNKGILAVFANDIALSNNMLLGILNGFNQILFHDRIGPGIIIFIGVVISFLLWLFISNSIEVGRSRFFIEKTKYKDTQADRLLYIFRNKKTLNVVKIMFLKQLYLLLWSLTIVGGIIKHYSYLMIPYILAENPDISKKEAFMLSRKMMDGQKWNCFKLDVSFIGYKILGILTFNIVNLLYTDPYYQMTYAHLYMEFRTKELEKNPKANAYFNDKSLEEEGNICKEVKKPNRKWLKIDYKRDYSISTLVLLFFTFAMIGWLWEVSLNLFMAGTFVNKGTLFGPWLPIYGLGGVLLILLINGLREKPALVFILSIVICGIIEYAASVYLEFMYNMKWWDYSGFFLNINGRICLEGLILFGLGGCAGIYVLAPLADNIYKKIPHTIKIVICIILIFFFTCDFVYSVVNPNSGEGITTVALLQK